MAPTEEIEDRKMVAAFLPLLLPGCLADGHNPFRPRLEEVGLVGSFDVVVKGVLDSRIQVRFRAVPGRPFSARLASRGGRDRVDVRGVLTAGKKGGYTLDLRLTEVTGQGGVKRRAFTADLALGKEELVCGGWVWWYAVRLVPAR
jgi:hypothetical protein